MIHYGDMTEAQHAYLEGRAFGARDERKKIVKNIWAELGDMPEALARIEAAYPDVFNTRNEEQQQNDT
jgi:hypothetical protein